MSISKQRLWRDRITVIQRYYKSPKFALIDLAFGLVALFVNPYRLCRKFLQKKGTSNIYAYGETPLSTYQRIVEICQIGPQDTWLELGAGRGKGCFWVSHFIGCKVIGIEWVPQFVWIAKSIQILLGCKNLSFECRDIHQVNTHSATFIYLYGNWPSLDVGSKTRVLTISEPLEGFKVLQTFWVRYPWGRTTAFLQQKLLP
jgi:hypothetical protein